MSIVRLKSGILGIGMKSGMNIVVGNEVRDDGMKSGIVEMKSGIVLVRIKKEMLDSISYHLYYSRLHDYHLSHPFQSC